MSCNAGTDIVNGLYENFIDEDTLRSSGDHHPMWKNSLHPHIVLHPMPMGSSVAWFFLDEEKGEFLYAACTINQMMYIQQRYIVLS